MHLVPNDLYERVAQRRTAELRSSAEVDLGPLPLPPWGSPLEVSRWVVDLYAARHRLPDLFARLDSLGVRDLGAMGVLWLGTPKPRQPTDPDLVDSFSVVDHSLRLTSGFELQPVVIDPDLALELSGFLEHRGWRAVTLRCAGEDWLALPSRLREPGGELFVVVGLEWSSTEFHRALSALNVVRDQLVGRLLWCGPPALHDASATEMPDLWSVRSTAFRADRGPGRATLPVRFPPVDPAPEWWLEDELRICDEHIGVTRAHLALHVAPYLLRRGRAGDASLARGLLEEAEHHLEPEGRTDARLVIARSYLADGRRELAAAIAADIGPQATNWALRRDLRVLESFLVATRSSPDYHAALALLDEAEAAWPTRVAWNAAKLLRAALEDRRGDSSRAADLLREIAASGTGLAEADLRADALSDLADLELGHGNPEGASPLRARAVVERAKLVVPAPSAGVGALVRA